MKGWILVDAKGLATDRDLSKWTNMAVGSRSAPAQVVVLGGARVFAAPPDPHFAAGGGVSAAAAARDILLRGCAAAARPRIRSAGR